MKKIKIVVIIMAFMISGFVLGVCGSIAIAKQTYPLTIWKENRNGQMETWKVVDEVTGVNYIVVAPNYSEHGNKYDGVCITPRLNADRSLYISK